VSDSTLTREQLVSMVLESLDRLPNANLNLPTQVNSSPYPDVQADRWSAAKIQFARDNNIVSGYQDGTFRPNQPVTRAELMAVLRRAAEYGQAISGEDSTLWPGQETFEFADIENHWAARTITQMSSYCSAASPLNEVGTRFYPDDSALRNYAAAATLRMLNCVSGDTAPQTDSDLG
ncbi:MAG: S-layer homology domain-containing protein, partial [Cyanobacteria bacterium J06626_14]